MGTRFSMGTRFFSMETGAQAWATSSGERPSVYLAPLITAAAAASGGHTYEHSFYNPKIEVFCNANGRDGSS